MWNLLGLWLLLPAALSDYAGVSAANTSESLLGITRLAVVSCLAEPDEPAISPDRLFDPHHLVDVQITLDADRWDRVRLQSRSLLDSLQRESAAKSPFEYAKGNVTIDGVLIKDVGIRKKGFLGSLDDHRPSLKIKFDKYVDQMPCGVLDRLTLNNNKQDPSRLSQRGRSPGIPD